MSPEIADEIRRQQWLAKGYYQSARQMRQALAHCKTVEGYDLIASYWQMDSEAGAKCSRDARALLQEWIGE